jgi:DNA-binding winged helix-turn-helix (wHTH) protein
MQEQNQLNRSGVVRMPRGRDGTVLTESRYYEFDGFLLDSRARALTKNGEPAPLPSKAFEALFLLIRHRDRVVTREQLSAALWPDVHVEETNLNHYIFLLRKTLTVTAKERAIIVTIPGRGYRFVADLREFDEAEKPPEDQPKLVPSAIIPPLKKQQVRRWISATAAAVIITGITVFSIHVRTSVPAEDQIIDWSPDGKWIVTRGVEGLVFVSATTGEKKRLATVSSAPTPHLSPDGKSLAFIKNGKLYITQTGTGETRFLK